MSPWAASTADDEGIIAYELDAIEDREGQAVSPEIMICVEPWPRAVLVDGSAVQLVEEPEINNVGFDWQLLPREEIRRF